MIVMTITAETLKVATGDLVWGLPARWNSYPAMEYVLEQACYAQVDPLWAAVPVEAVA